MDALRISGVENGVYLDYKTTFSCAADWKQGEGIFVPWSARVPRASGDFADSRSFGFNNSEIFCLLNTINPQFALVKRLTL